MRHDAWLVKFCTGCSCKLQWLLIIWFLIDININRDDALSSSTIYMQILLSPAYDAAICGNGS